MSRTMKYSMLVLILMMGWGCRKEILEEDAHFFRFFGTNDVDQGHTVQTTADGGYVLAGSLSPNGDQDMAIIRTDAEGALLWSRTFGQEGNDQAHFVRELANGDFLLAGELDPGDGNRNAYLVRLDASGTTLWEKDFGGPMRDGIRSFVVMPGGDFLLAGFSGSLAVPPSSSDPDMWLLRVSSEGDSLGSSTIGGAGDDVAWSLVPLRAGGFLVGGFTSSNAGQGYDAMLALVDAAGNFQQSLSLGSSEDDFGHAVLETADGSIALLGMTFANGNDFDIHLWKVGAGLTGLESETSFGGSQNDRSLAYQLVESTDGNLILVGQTQSFGNGANDLIMIKTTPDGEQIWQRVYGGSNDDQGFGIAHSAHGGYAVIGKSKSFVSNPNFDIVLLSVDSSGQAISVNQ